MWELPRAQNWAWLAVTTFRRCHRNGVRWRQIRQKSAMFLASTVWLKKDWRASSRYSKAQWPRSLRSLGPYLKTSVRYFTVQTSRSVNNPLLFERKLASSQRDAEPGTYVNKLFCSENKQKEFLQIFFLKWIFIKCWFFFVNTWKFILKQLVASGPVITSLYSLRLRLSEYRLVITSTSVTNC